MMHLGLYDLVWGQTEPIFWFGIPVSLSYVLCIALFSLLTTTQTHTLISVQAHAHIHQFKWNLGCLICFKTNLKAIYIILSWVRKKLLLENNVELKVEALDQEDVSLPERETGSKQWQSKESCWWSLCQSSHSNFSLTGSWHASWLCQEMCFWHLRGEKRARKETLGPFKWLHNLSQIFIL